MVGWQILVFMAISRDTSTCNSSIQNRHAAHQTSHILLLLFINTVVYLWTLLLHEQDVIHLEPSAISLTCVS